MKKKINHATTAPVDDANQSNHNQLDIASPSYKADILSLAEKKAGLVHPW